MIAVRSIGRLGNQLFLFASVARARKNNEIVVGFGFVELLAFFPSLPRWFLVVPVGHRFDRLLKKTFRFLAAHRRFPVLSAFTISPAGHLVPPRHFGVIKIFEVGLCQSPTLAPLKPVLALCEGIEPPLVPRLGRDSAVGPNALVSGGSAVVHVRLDDYENFRVNGLPAVLPTEWYLASIEAMAKEYEVKSFIFISDDLDQTRERFGEVRGARFEDLDAKDSFRLLSWSKYAIISASTFAWWASRVALARNPTGVHYAPRFWMGHRSASWYPSEAIHSDFLDYR